MPDTKEPAPLWELNLKRFPNRKPCWPPFIYEPTAPDGQRHVAHLDIDADKLLEQRGRILAAAPRLLNAAEALLKDWDSPSLSDDTPINERFDALRDAVKAAREGVAR